MSVCRSSTLALGDVTTRRSGRSLGGLPPPPPPPPPPNTPSTSNTTWYAAAGGLPDGACVDAEGGFWSASVYGWAVIRVSPDGTVDERIELPLEKPSMPAFGGADLSTMYVTTIGAAGGTPSAPGRDGFVPGSLLAIDSVGVTGVVDPVYIG